VDASDYRVQLLIRAAATEPGLEFHDEQGEGLLAWDRVLGALAAEVGEPQGVRTVVFDLVVRTEAPVEVYRFDSDPYDGAQEMARALLRHLGPDRTSSSIKSIAVDGMATRWYPDLESLAAANLEALS
jgi:hypothetical protein